MIENLVSLYNDKNYVNLCPICKLGNGALCYEHAILTKDFNWIKNYLNNLDKFDNNTLYIIDYAISDRKSLVINKLDIVNGKLNIEGYLDKNSCSEYMEYKLKEILILEKSKINIIRIINQEKLNGNY